LSQPQGQPSVTVLWLCQQTCVSHTRTLDDASPFRSRRRNNSGEYSSLTRAKTLRHGGLKIRRRPRFRVTQNPKGKDRRACQEQIRASYQPARSHLTHDGWTWRSLMRLCGKRQDFKAVIHRYIVIRLMSRAGDAHRCCGPLAYSYRSDAELGWHECSIAVLTSGFSKSHGCGQEQQFV
jgi:hypothetical protein